ncbi:MAG: hypothetical protein ACRC33_17725 [Gemmataceae bacterium]
MDLSDALDQIDAIHAHAARGETYRGYHPHALAASGLVGLLAALARPDAFLPFWCAVGVAAGLVAAAPTLADYFRRDTALGRRRTRVVARQFLPCLLAGVILTLAVARPGYRDACTPLLPGAWSLLFGLGVVASVPFLPRLTPVVAAWYLAAGAALLWSAGGPPTGWTVGVPFGVGQCLAAAVVWHDRRAAHD